MKKKTATAIIFSLVFPTVMAAKPQAEAVTMDFEKTAKGSVPKGWIVATDDWQGNVVEGNSPQGNKHFKFTFLGQATSPYGVFMTALSGEEYQGKKVVLTAKIKSDTPGVKAYMWMRVDRESGDQGAFDNMDDRPVTVGDWKEARISFTVDSDAKRICFGLCGVGEGTVRMDDVKLQIVN